MTRIPHTDSPIETRQALQRLVFQTDAITAGASGYILVGQGIGVAPAWQALSTAIDHGGLGGLGDDDHTIYSLADGTRAFTGAVVGIDPTLESHLATRQYVDDSVHFIFEYYFNDTASNIGGIYYKMLDEHTGEAESSFTTAGLGTGDDQALVNFATDPNNPGVDVLESGVYTAHIHVEKTVGTKPVKIYCTFVRYEADTTETVIATSATSNYITSSVEVRLHATAVADTQLALTDRIVVKFYANVESSGSAVTVVLYAEGTTSSHVAVPITTEVLDAIFLRQDGTKDLVGNLAVGVGITIDSRDLSVDGTKLDGIEALADVTDATNVAAAGAAMSGGAFHDGFSDFVGNEHIDHSAVSISTSTGLTGGGTIASTRTLSLSHLGIESLSDAGADKMLFWDDGGSAAGWLAVTGSGKGIVTTNLEINAGFVDRGDPSVYDRAFGDFTFDATWHNLNLGPGGLAIIPAGAYAVNIGGYIKGTAANQFILIRKNGNSNAINTGRVYTQAGATYIFYDLIIPVDSNGIIEYYGHASLDDATLVVKGWFI